MDPLSKRGISELVERSHRDGLVLIVGSGINAGAVPQWSQLLQDLLARTLKDASIEDDRIAAHEHELARWCRANLDAGGLATLAKAILGPARYRAEIQDKIYAGAGRIQTDLEKYCQAPKPPDDHPEFAYLRAIAELASLPTVRAVATFNFDTLLEVAVSALHKRAPVAHFGKVKSAFAEPSPQKPPLPVYHVHGLLFASDSIVHSPDESVVFAYDEYFETNADPLAWETSTVVHLLRNYCTLWLGVSLRDWNMLRLLDASCVGQADIQAYCLQCLEEIRLESTLVLPVEPKNKQSEVEEEKAYGDEAKQLWNEHLTLRADSAEVRSTAMRLQSTLLRAVGVQLLIGNARFSDLPHVLDEKITAPLRALSPENIRHEKA